MGWDPKTGKPSEERLKALKLTLFTIDLRNNRTRWTEDRISDTESASSSLTQAGHLVEIKTYYSKMRNIF